jgi:hypothetical protein
LFADHTFRSIIVITDINALPPPRIRHRIKRKGRPSGIGPGGLPILAKYAPPKNKIQWRGSFATLAAIRLASL